MQKPQNIRRILQISVLACAVADAALLLVYLSPWVPSRAEAAARVNSERVQLEILRERVNRLQQLQAHLGRSRQQADELVQSSMRPEGTVFSDVLTEFNRMAQRTRVRASNIAFQPSKETQAGLRQIGITANLEGQYSDVIEFLNAVERSPIFFIVNEISLSEGAGESHEKGVIRLYVQMQTYARAEGEDTSAT
jgi:Tfp pilus assembly protein PilO